MSTLQLAIHTAGPLKDLFNCSSLSSDCFSRESSVLSPHAAGSLSQCPLKAAEGFL